MDALHDNALESLSAADFLVKKIFHHCGLLFLTYYSMYYMAKAVLISIGFKVSGEVSHCVTGDVLIVLVINKLKKQILEDLDEARTEFDEIDDLTDDIIELYDLEHKKRK
ncbi:hypothetical protein BK008_02205 [Methanobacterium sp. MZ-A1]|uniref:hypothetical protein n=1 Tax=Methanobacterium sp. MZ-A1 TaxID=1911685 RepID=UPI000C2CE62A|nr:hypothetical protein [Methanobacterium sp. MZ-A1]AUB57247.1 hypothetical protein BK008_02205 [Methanobacterium sp. MZ-A1]